MKFDIYITCLILSYIIRGVKTRIDTKQTIVLLSFDGFRHDFIEQENLKNFKEIARSGVRAKSLQTTFVTKTFPNHFTMVTGLYEESHGIVGNYMYDPVYKEHFDPMQSSEDPKWWNATTPIWISNEIQFLKDSKRTRKSATILWPGSETSYDGHWPYYTRKKYESNMTAKNRFDRILNLLTEPNPVNFIACYFDEPDKTAHLYGPDHRNTSRVLKELDDTIGHFVERLKSVDLYDKINIMLVSDHGMASVPSKNIIKLSNIIHPNEYDLVSYGTFLLIRPKKGMTKKIYKKLKNITHIKTYYRQDIPERWHYKNNRRVTKIFAIADEGYYVTPGQANDYPYPKGDHGYDNTLMSMHGIFIAHGPAFKKKHEIDIVYNIDIYSLMCHILDINPHPNNGTFEGVQDMVAEKTIFKVLMKSPALAITLLSVCGIFVLVVILGCTISCYRNLVKSSKYSKLSSNEEPLARWHEDDEVTEFDLRER